MVNQELTLRPLVHLLNREADAGQTALQMLRATPVTTWPDYFAARPGWMSYGVFRTVLSYAREQFDRDPRLALAITTFVTERVDDIETPPDTIVLSAFIRGLAYKEHGNAFFGLAKYPEAADAAERAIQIFGTMPALAVDVAWATLLRAMCLDELEQTVDALNLVMRSVRLFGEHSEPRGYMVSLQVCGGILFGLEEYGAARDAYSIALTIAEELNDQKERARTLNSIGRCSVVLDEFELGEQQLRQAFRLFHQERMESEMLRSVIGFADVQFRRGNLQIAIDTFHSVYADLLHFGMIVPAAQVLVELTDVVTRLTGDLTYARSECAQLAARLGDYDLPGNVRAAVAYVARITAAAESVSQVRAALEYVKQFLSDILASPSVAFAPA